MGAAHAIEHASIADALTGKRLDALKQCVAIDVTGGVRTSRVCATCAG